VEIVVSARNAVVSDSMKQRGKRAVERIARRLGQTVAARISFEEDGPQRRVEIVLRAPRQRNLIAESTAKFFGVALTAAILRLQAQLPKKDTRKSRSRKLARA
jgi:ribosome-associated translation inhibitor RaiA